MNLLDELHASNLSEADSTSAIAVDLRELPRYSVADVALYLHIPQRTLRSWLVAKRSPSGSDVRVSRPLIDPADPSGNRLSFFNLVEAHILKSTRQRDEVPMSAIRSALNYAASDSSPHPLITRKFLTEGRFLFEERLGQLVNASKFGQLAFDPILSSFLNRIDRDAAGQPYVLYPFIPNKPESRMVAIKPGVSSGVPTVTGTGISVSILFGRRKAGDTIADLADDYGLATEQVGDAISYLDAA